MLVIHNDAELWSAICELDAYLDLGYGAGEVPRRFDELADAIWEYEERTDVMSRPHDGSRMSGD